MKLINYHRIGITKVIFIALFVIGGLAQAETITVGSPRRGDYDFYAIQDAINAANDGDVVLVAPQEYVISSPITFQGKAITVRSEDGPEQTTIHPYQGYEISIVVFENGEDSRSILEGFTIKDSPERGVSCENSSPCINNCVFIDNWESGIQCLSASPIIDNCLITGSQGDSGINCRENSSPTISNCIISDNIAEGSGGGGIYCNDSSPTITNTFIESNFAGEGGGMYNGAGSSPTLTNCTFEFNEASWSGGGMLNIDNSSPTLTNCIFNGNSADLGGGMNNYESSPSVTNCIFTGNSGVDGGGMYNENNCHSTVTNCTFSDNTADFGGGMWSELSNPSVTNCTFNSNSADFGGGMGNYNNSHSTVINCIIWGNNAPNGEQIYNVQGSSTTVSYSNISFAGRGFWPGEGNIKEDPLFADPNNGDYHLKSSAGRWDPNSQSWVLDDVNSPCIDAGDPQSPVAFEPYLNGIYINMGAYGGTEQASKSPSGLNTNYGYGTGEPNNPYLIYTAEQLNTLGNELNDWDKNFTLMADIDLSEYLYDRAVIASDTDDVEDGFQGTPFTGVFDGNDYTISNLRVQGDSFLGLFGQLGNSAEITNINLEAVDVNGTGDYIGGLAGFNFGYITESHSTGDVSGSSNIGGLLGNNFGIVIQCYSTGLVSGNNYVGGFVGNNCCGLITSSYSTVDVFGVSYVGGLAGDNMFGCINLCYSKGSVNGDQYVGGLTGCYIDGFVFNCYSVAVVIGNIGVGGLVGGPSNGSGWGLGIHYVGGSFWDVESSGQSGSYGGTGKTTAEMQTRSTFIDAGWDFMHEAENGIYDIWWIDQDQDYPHLWWEPTTTVVSGDVEVTTIYQINCSGGEVSPFTADQYYSGGLIWSTSNDIDTTGVTNPAPEEVYQSVRLGEMTYTFPNLTSGASYKVRLHCSEVFAASANNRIFNVTINGDTVLSNYNIFSEAGDLNKAVVEEFTVTANMSGQIVIDFTVVSLLPAIAGIEIIN